MRLASNAVPRGALAALVPFLPLVLLACGRDTDRGTAGSAVETAAIRIAPDGPLPDTGTDLAVPPAAPDPGGPPVAQAVIRRLRRVERIEPRPSLGAGPLAAGPGGAGQVAAPRFVGRAAASAAEVPFALVHTSVVAQVSGNVARVEVTQYYANPSPDRLEAIYAFPLPPNAAVTDMVFRIGSRVVLSDVRRREQARREYERARSEGKAAALTERERPNLFTQSVANIPPGATVAVVIRYLHEVTFDDGRYQLHFPTTIGPRYVPGEPIGQEGPGWAPDTDRVPDASRITPPVVAPGQPAPHDVDILVRLLPGEAFEDVAASSHRVETGLDGQGARVVALAEDDRRPDKDFVLGWRAAGQAPSAHALVQRERGGDYLLLFLQPPAEVVKAQVRPKELVFLLDKSGSMSGAPIARAKALIARALQASGPDDTFQIIAFDGAAQSMTAGAIPANPQNVARGLAWLESLEGGGGTEMLAGIRAALSQQADPRRLRMVVFCTDGFIGNEPEVIEAVAELRGQARVFGFGIGTSVNRYLIEGVGRAGRGASEVLDLEQAPEAAVQRLFRRLDRPVLTELTASFEGGGVKDLEPEGLPDLFAGQPLVLAGRIEGAAPAHVLLRGRLGEAPWSARIPIAQGAPAPGDEPAAGTLWALRRVDALLEARPGAPAPETVEAVITVAMRFKLVTRYTSLVAVERELRVDPNLPLTRVAVPGLLPRGVSHEGIFGPASEVQVLPARVKPGDPELRVLAPADAVAVRVALPFEAAPRDALRDNIRGDWVLRFLVPPAFPDGSYQARVTIVHGDGREEERGSPIRVDTTPAAVAVLSAPASVRPGEAVTLLLKPALPASRLPALVVQAGGLPAALKGAMEVKEVLVRAPWGEIVRARMEGQLGAYRAVLHVPGSAQAGRALFEVVASDAAGNVSRRAVEVAVAAPPPPAPPVGDRGTRILFWLLVAGPAALAATGTWVLIRRRPPPPPLSHVLLVGSLADMQRSGLRRSGARS